MSQVTNVVLTTHVSECHDEISFVNACLEKSEAGGGGRFVEVSGHAGGYKHMECFVYLSAFNHADTEFILAAIDKAPWRDKDMVQAYVKEQEEETFTLRYDGRILPKVVDSSR